MIKTTLHTALMEDLSGGIDVTGAAIIPPGVSARASFVARTAGVLAGLPFALETFDLIQQSAAPVKTVVHFKDGDAVQSGDIIAEIHGPADVILKGERTALNIMTHLSGIATLTADFVKRTAHTKARICDTRKTLPGLRHAQKYAVRCGGGYNHRFGLSDTILIKDNHIAVAGSVEEALSRAVAAAGHTVKIEIEVDTLDQLEAVLAHGGADIVMLDNMTPQTLKQAVDMIDERLISEASGGVTLETVTGIAETGVDYISVGALTHSAPALDIGLDINMDGHEH